MQKIILENGLTLLLSKKESNSVVISATVKMGSNYESREENGVSHFIEHLVFNGPKGYNKKTLVEKIDSLGGEINAFTTNNFTVFYVKVLSKHFSKAFKVIEKIVLHPYFSKKRIEDERKIILSELDQSEDRNDQKVVDNLNEILYYRHPFGKTILGKKETIKKINKKVLEKNYNRFYVPNNMIVSVTGEFETGNVLDFVEGSFGRIKRKEMKLDFPKIPSNRHKENVLKRNIEQAYVALGMKVMKAGSREKYAMYLIDAILSGGLSSRLIQEIREKRGLAYSVEAMFDVEMDYANYIVFAGVRKENIEKVRKIILKEFRKLKEKKVSEKQLKKAKQYIEGQLLLKNETTIGAMNNLIEFELTGESNVEGFLRKIFAVTSEDILRVAKKYLQTEKYCFSVVQPK